MKPCAVNHIAFVCEDIDTALHFWQDVMGLKVERRTIVDEQEADIAFLKLGDLKIELLQPTAEDSAMARFLMKRGPGFHHICFEVEDLESSLNFLQGKGVQLIHTEPIEGEDGLRYAFLHPKSTLGVLIELYDRPSQSPQTTEPHTLPPDKSIREANCS